MLSGAVGVRLTLCQPALYILARFYG
jgi:prevent-host-death family protein